MSKKLTAMLLAIVLFVGGFVAIQNPVAAGTDTVVIIPDAGLKAALNRAVGQADDADITDTQMETIKYLQVIASNNLTIADFTGIEYAINLESIYITGGLTASDITPITLLPKLNTLTLSGNNLETLPDMNGMTSLTSLSLYTPISSDEFTKFNQLPNLRYASFESNMKITSIAALAELPNLDTLRCQTCGISDFTVINQFPKLISLAAYGQNTGRYNAPVELTATELQYDEAAGTIFFPFSMMPDRLTNFDGEQSPFTTSNSASNTYFDFNGVQLPSSRLSIDSSGITVTGVTREEFDGIDTFEYNARYTWSAGQYAEPPGFSFYSLTGGTYLQIFNVDHSLAITADPEITYSVDAAKSEAEFLSDVHATTNDGSPITSDFATAVNLNVPGRYIVTLNAQNTLGVQADPVQVVVIVTDNTPINPPTDNNNDTTSNNNNPDLPVTGQEFAAPVLVGLLIITAAAGLLYMRRK
ncbi:LapB repeat-containing protein [Culicoidibacter larvae]|uniref:Leucine-rich repeat domain-containing protein n=1 Tax=Culicoidibacter larvae TaxID=2579976 RepID=A0A5R8QAK3_9FIRM|nr:LapB repeat-containing protein [Culicoidibacter larvae]TLG72954.1 leucine-rich repeat domain-containing protein [Culicoidibacter larvae]